MASRQFSLPTVLRMVPHPDDFVQNVTVHDEHSKLTVEAFRQTLLVVFAYPYGDFAGLGIGG